MGRDLGVENWDYCLPIHPSILFLLSPLQSDLVLFSSSLPLPYVTHSILCTAYIYFLLHFLSDLISLFIPSLPHMLLKFNASMKGRSTDTKKQAE